MRLTFLGTAAGCPSRHRNVSALIVALDSSRDWYLVDCGEGTQHQIMRCRYTLNHLQGIFITHVHGDHMFGLPGLITSASMQGRTRPLRIYAPQGVESFVRHALSCAAVTRLPFELEFIRSDHDGFLQTTPEFTISAHPLSHRVPCYGYGFREHNEPGPLNPYRLAQYNVPRGPLWGQLQQGQPVTLADGNRIQPAQVKDPERPGRYALIGGDNDQPEILLPALKGADILVHEATFSTAVLEKVGDQWMHSTPAMVGQAAQKAGVKHLLLTHFSNRYQIHPREGQQDIEQLRQEALAHYSGSVILARDLACWELNKEGELQEL